MLTTDQKGSIAEAEITAAAIRLGVYRPLSEGERCDLIFDLRPTLMRVQCKWASWSEVLLLSAVTRADAIRLA